MAITEGGAACIFPFVWMQNTKLFIIVSNQWEIKVVCEFYLPADVASAGKQKMQKMIWMLKRHDVWIRLILNYEYSEKKKWGEKERLSQIPTRTLQFAVWKLWGGTELEIGAWIRLRKAYIWMSYIIMFLLTIWHCKKMRTRLALADQEHLQIKWLNQSEVKERLKGERNRDNVTLAGAPANTAHHHHLLPSK